LVNAFWAILVTGLIIFLAGVPISRYAASHGVDMDHLTRVVGFGYIGPTVSSRAITAYALCFDTGRAVWQTSLARKLLQSYFGTLKAGTASMQAPEQLLDWLHVYEKLGVETRTAAEGLAISKVGELARR